VVCKRAIISLRWHYNRKVQFIWLAGARDIGAARQRGWFATAMGATGLREAPKAFVADSKSHSEFSVLSDIER